VTDLREYVLIVDGQTEIKSFRAKFEKEYRCVPGIRKHPGGGGSISAQGYAHAASGVVFLCLRRKYVRIICVTDRENRKKEGIDFGIEIRDALINLVKSRGHYSREELEGKISVCVADRNFENWIIADIEGIRSLTDLVSDRAEQGSFDGKNGTVILKRIMRVPYRKLQHAPKLFKQVSFQRAATNSPSFKQFAVELDLAT
jgi:hypothetical protein